MGMLFTAIIFAGLTVAAFTLVKKKLTLNALGATGIKASAWVLATITVAVLVGSMFTIVPPRTVGIEVQFGKPVNSLANGLHFKSPISSVEKLDGAVQNNVYDTALGNPVQVRLGNDSLASANASIQWQLRTDNAMEVFLSYRTFENIQANLVERNFNDAMNEVTKSYNPLGKEGADGGSGDKSKMAGLVLENLRKKVGNYIDVIDVTIPLINYDPETQNRINELQSEIARTRIAEQKKNTATAEAQANKALETSLSDEVLVSKCLDIIAASGQSPIGCFPGTNVQPYTNVTEQPKG